MRSFSVEDKLIDYSTGEVIQKHIRRKICAEDNYCKIYDEGLAYLFGLTKAQRNLLDMIGVEMTFAEDGQVVRFTPDIKQKIENKCQLKRNSINKMLVSFVDLGILRRIAMGAYKVNPYIMGKGAWEDIMTLREQFDSEVANNARE